jgi:hypothetical protein
LMPLSAQPPFSNPHQSLSKFQHSTHSSAKPLSTFVHSSHSQLSESDPDSFMVTIGLPTVKSGMSFKFLFDFAEISHSFQLKANHDVHCS